MWCIRTRGRKVSSFINLADSTTVELHPSTGIAHGFQVQNSHRYTAAQFRADSRSTQQGWIQDTNKVCALTSENELIQLAEIIICDEESTRSARMHRSIERVLESKSVQYNLEGAMRMKSPSVLTLERRHNGAVRSASHTLGAVFMVVHSQLLDVITGCGAELHGGRAAVQGNVPS